MSTVVENLTNEIQQLTTALAEPQDRTTEMAMRERLAYTSARLADLEAGATYAEVSTEDLQTQLEADELAREELYPQMRAAMEDRANRPALARKLEREYNELAQHQAGIRTEVESRVLAGANALGFRQRADKVAEREIDEQDKEALAGLADWRRAKAAEQMAESRDRRIAKHVESVHERLWADAERSIGAEMLYGRGGIPAEVPMTEGDEDGADQE